MVKFFSLTKELILTKSLNKLINRFKINDEISLIKTIFFRFALYIFANGKRKMLDYW